MKMSRKQLKITKMFKKGATKRTDDDDCAELEEEVRQLEQTLRDKQTELFQIQRNLLKKKAPPPKKKEYNFVRPERIILNNAIESLKKDMEVYAMLTGITVQSYVENEHCSVVFHMQHDSDHLVEHGLRIDLTTGKKEISSMSLPLGFNLNGVLKEFKTVMEPDCLRAIRRALVAYYDRLDQFQRLQKLLNVEAELFKTLDGSHMEVPVLVQGDDEEDQFRLKMLLEYRVYDIRPKNISIELSEQIDECEDVEDVIGAQCAVFKERPLHKAFKQAFIVGGGRYRMVLQMGPRQEKQVRRKKRFPPTKHQYNDDTFQPEDCSDPDDDDDSLE